MGHVDVQRITHTLPDGRVLLSDIAFRVGEGAKVALVGANGTGKTTLLRMIAGDDAPQEGAVVVGGGLGVMRQFVGRADDPNRPETVRDLLLTVSPAPIRNAAKRVDELELKLMDDESESLQMAYAQAISDYSDVGGYDSEVLWDVCSVAALDLPWEKVQNRPIATLSGGEQKRLVLEYLLRGRDEVLLLDEPDNYLDVPA